VGAGELCAERLAWLDATLRRRPQSPTLLMMHHPPFVTGIGHMDRVGLAGIDGLAAVIARHPQVERLIAGHLHRAITVRFAGTVATTCPSPAHQVALDLDPDARRVIAVAPVGSLAIAIVVNAQLLYPGGSIADAVVAVVGGALVTEALVHAVRRGRAGPRAAPELSP